MHISLLPSPTRRWAVLLLAAALSACGDSAPPRVAQPPSGGAAQTDGNWRGFLFDASGSRHNPAESILRPDNVGQLELKWAFVFPDTDGAQSSQPAVVDGVLYVGARNGLFYALDAQTGKEIWRFDTRAVIGDSAQFTELGRVLDTLTGTAGALLDTPGFSVFPRNLLRNGPAVVDGVVYFGDFFGYLYALDAASGRLLWATELDAHREAIVTSSPLVHGGRVYVGVSSNEVFSATLPTYPCCQARGSVVALDARSGDVLWKYYTVPPARRDGSYFSGTPRFAPSGVSVWSSPALDVRTQTLYFGTGPNYSGTTERSDAVIALDARTGQERWVRQMTEGDHWTAACLFFPDVPGGACPQNGPDWDFGASPNLFQVDGRMLVGIGQKSGVYHVLDAATGDIVWQKRLSSVEVAGGPAGQGGIQWGSSYDGRRIYVATYNAQPGTLFALDPASGGILWETPNPADGCSSGGALFSVPGACSEGMGAAVSSSPGLVYEGSRDGKFRIFSAETGEILFTYDTVREYSGVNGERGRGGSIGHGGATVTGGRVYVNSGYSTSEAPLTGIKGAVLLAFGLPASASNEIRR